jgi:hypothetical protein
VLAAGIMAIVYRLDARDREERSAQRVRVRG